MLELDARRAIEESVEEVLETMFFASVVPDSPGEAVSPEEAVVARVAFEGEPPGWLAVEVARTAARSLAADFLGEEEPGLEERRVEEVVCELANMICGSVLSRMESETLFHLDSPDLLKETLDVSAEYPSASSGNTTIHAVDIGSGPLRIMLHTGSAPCPAAAKSAS